MITIPRKSKEMIKKSNTDDNPRDKLIVIIWITVAVSFISGSSIYLLHKPTYDVFLSEIPVHTDEIHDWPKQNNDTPCDNVVSSQETLSTDSNKKCTEYAAKHAYEFVKDKRDIKAQEGMWRAATELLKLTTYQLIGLVVSIIMSIGGLAALVLTLRATQDAVQQTIKANRIAKRSSKKAIKEARTANNATLIPYFKITTEGIVERQEGEHDGRSYYIIGIAFENIGKTPAKDVANVVISKGDMALSNTNFSFKRFIQVEDTSKKYVISPSEIIKLVVVGYFDDMPIRKTIISDEKSLNSGGFYSYRFNGSFTYADIESVGSRKRCDFVISYNWFQDDVVTSLEFDFPIARLTDYSNLPLKSKEINAVEHNDKT